MSVPEQTMIGLGLLCGILTILIALDAIVTRVCGPDPDLQRPWSADEPFRWRR